MFNFKKKNDIPAFYELSLKKVIITGDVFGKFGEYTIEQVFVNERKNPLEISYTFPITETATVTGFKVQVGEKIMHGICKEKEEAKKEYVNNLLKGNSAYMLNQDTANVFNVMVGKVLPVEEVHIVISYLDMYDIVDNRIRLIIPTLVNQRYKSAITDGLNYGQVNYTVDFRINIHKVLKYNSIKSINHEVTQTEDDKQIVITANNYDMSKDFVLDMKFEEISTSNAYYSNTKNGEKAVLLSFMPELEEIEDTEKEYIFIADVSGSMGHSDKITKMKEALKRCIRELDVGDRFNIIPFASKFSFFKMESVEVNDDIIEEAMKYIDCLRANGGTEILAPIQFALYEKSDNKVIIVLTDGEVGNEDEIVSFVSKNIYNSKLFAIGIDTSVNTAFIKSLAKAGDGKAEFIYPNEEMEDAIVRTFARIQSPIVRDVKVDYGKNDVVSEIKQDNTLFNYEFYQVASLLKDIEDDITLTGMLGEKKVSWTIARDSITPIDGKLELVYAKKSIDSLEEQIRSYEKDFRNTNARTMIEEYKKRIVAISTEYNIASKYTSFISVNEREEKVFEQTDFENVTLSGLEYKKFRTSPFCASSAPGKLSRTPSFDMQDMDVICEGMGEPIVAEEAIDNIIEENFNDWKTFDVYTLLLSISYLYLHGTSLPLENIFNEYVKECKVEWNDKTIQTILLFMYQQNIFRNIILDNLLTGVYKKVAITGAEYKYDILELDFGEDNSKVLQNNKTLREEAIKGLRSMI